MLHIDESFGTFEHEIKSSVLAFDFNSVLLHKLQAGLTVRMGFYYPGYENCVTRSTTVQWCPGMMREIDA